MDNNYSEHKTDSIFEFGIDDVAQSHMMETARWGKFLAIVGFIFLGLVILFGLFSIAGASSLSRAFGGSASIASIFIIYIIVAGIYFYPTFALLKFSRMMKPALAHRNQQMFNDALGYLKNMFRYIGIVVLIMLVIYGLSFLFLIIAATTRL